MEIIIKMGGVEITDGQGRRGQGIWKETNDRVESGIFYKVG